MATEEQGGQGSGPGPVLVIILYIMALFLPLVGIIIGLIYGMSSDPRKKAVGRMCILLGIISIVLSIICYFWWIVTWWVWF